MSLFNKLNKKKLIDQNFIKFVVALDRGEEWAQKKYKELWDRNEPDLLSKMDEARIEIYSDDAKKGNIDAQYWLGFSLRRTNPNEAMKWLIPLANNGDVDAMIALAMGYTEFGGFGDIPEKYRYWYKLAAEAGSAEAQVVIGLQYYIDGEYHEALKWYSEAAKQKHSEGASGVAKCYECFKSSLFLEDSKLSSEEKKNLEKRYNDLIEDSYICAANWAKTEMEYETAFNGLGWFYKGLLYNEPSLDNARRAAYFFYSAYLCGNDYALPQFEEINSKYNLQVDTSDIEGWANKVRLFK